MGVREFNPGGTLNGLSQLQLLDLSNNRIQTIFPLSFMPLNNVQNLYLNGNFLTLIQANTFLGLSSLSNLQIQDNKIHTIMVLGLSGLPKIDKIDFSNNELETIPYSMFNLKDFPDTWGHISTGHSASHLSLSGNNIVCNYTLCWMKLAWNDGWLYSDDFACFNASNYDTWYSYRASGELHCMNSKYKTILSLSWLLSSFIGKLAQSAKEQNRESFCTLRYTG